MNTTSKPKKIPIKINESKLNELFHKQLDILLQTKVNCRSVNICIGVVGDDPIVFTLQKGDIEKQWGLMEFNKIIEEET